MGSWMPLTTTLVNTSVSCLPHQSVLIHTAGLPALRQTHVYSKSTLVLVSTISILNERAFQDQVVQSCNRTHVNNVCMGMHAFIRGLCVCIHHYHHTPTQGNFRFSYLEVQGIQSLHCNLIP